MTKKEKAVKDLQDKIATASPSGVNGTFVSDLKELSAAVDKANEEVEG